MRRQAVGKMLDAGSMASLAVSITPHEPVGLMLRTDFQPSAALQALLTAVRQEAARRRIAKPSSTRKTVNQR